MSDEPAKLAEALKAVTDRTPLITRGVVNAIKSSKPLAWRKHQFDIAVRQARALHDDLLLRQVALGWRDSKDDAA